MDQDNEGFDLEELEEDMEEVDIDSLLAEQENKTKTIDTKINYDVAMSVRLNDPFASIATKIRDSLLDVNLNSVEQTYIQFINHHKAYTDYINDIAYNLNVAQKEGRQVHLPKGYGEQLKNARDELNRFLEEMPDAGKKETKCVSDKKLRIKIRLRHKDKEYIEKIKRMTGLRFNALSEASLSGLNLEALPTAKTQDVISTIVNPTVKNLRQIKSHIECGRVYFQSEDKKQNNIKFFNSLIKKYTNIKAQVDDNITNFKRR